MEYLTERARELHVSYLWEAEFSTKDAQGNVQPVANHYIVTNTQNMGGEVQDVIKILQRKIADEQKRAPEDVFVHRLTLQGTTIGYSKPISAVGKPNLEKDGDRIVPNDAFIHAVSNLWEKLGPSATEVKIEHKVAVDNSVDYVYREYDR